MTYDELRNKAQFSLNPHNYLSNRIFIENPYLIYNPPVNPVGNSAHFTINDECSAICCTEEEAVILHELVWKINPKLFIEIGSYAGWSTAHILRALDDDSLMFCVDNLSECNKPDLVRQVLLDVLKPYSNAYLFEQDSTLFLNSLTQKADMIFIDGFHRDGKPLLDVKAAVKALKPDGYIVLHDTWMPDVYQACQWLYERGYQCWTFSTDNLLEIYTKGDLSWIKEIAA